MSKIAVLFSGGGVLDTAIHEMGLKTDLAVEYDPGRVELSTAIADSYAKNYPNTELLRTPVESVNWIPYMGDDWMLLHASPSCKNFSAANSEGKETEQDLKAAIGIVNAITALRPYYFTLEQVRGYFATESIKLIMCALSNLGYSITYDVLNANFYGVPQRRERLFLTCCRNGTTVGLPPMQRPISWGEVLGDRIESMREICPSPAQINALDAVRTCYPDSYTFLIQKRSYHGKNLAVKHFWESAPVITCALFSDSHGSNRRSFFDIWYKGDWLTLSIKDMAMLQTMPDWYILPEETRVAGSIIGNGVPTKLYEAILKQLFRHYQRR
ncbi:DNA cytosine methyltransferase [Brasilonema sp. CT11]|nr:DNA cytosine methyltransferase [Brasilonema sp. CT11]